MSGSITYQWVKQLIPKKEWNNFYSGNNSYCLLETINGDPVVGFLIVHPDNRCKPCTDEDLRKIDIYRRANHIYPFPLEEVKKDEVPPIDEIDVESIEM